MELRARERYRVVCLKMSVGVPPERPDPVAGRDA